VVELAGLGPAEMVEEPGISGAKPLAERPRGAALLSRLRAGDTLIVARLDRAFRNAADALATAERFKAQRIDLIVADMGTDPVTGNGVSRMFFGMLALVAEFERERLRERLADGRAGKRAGGGHVGGSAPFGFRKVGAGRAARLEPVPEQQEAIATMRRLRGEGRSLRAIAAAVHERHGIKVSHLAVRRALATEGASPSPDAPHRVAREAAASAPHPPRPARDDRHPLPRVSHLHGGSP
jgi:DNA invertase Pin-like site-specific DNA recombinase